MHEHKNTHITTTTKQWKSHQSCEFKQHYGNIHSYCSQVFNARATTKAAIELIPIPSTILPQAGHVLQRWMRKLGGKETSKNKCIFTKKFTPWKSDLSCGWHYVNVEPIVAPTRGFHTSVRRSPTLQCECQVNQMGIQNSISHLRAVFKWLSKNLNQSSYSDQS